MLKVNQRCEMIHASDSITLALYKFGTNFHVITISNVILVLSKSEIKQSPKFVKIKAKLINNFLHFEDFSGQQQLIGNQHCNRKLLRF